MTTWPRGTAVDSLMVRRSAPESNPTVDTEVPNVGSNEDHGRASCASITSTSAAKSSVSNPTDWWTIVPSRPMT